MFYPGIRVILIIIHTIGAIGLFLLGQPLWAIIVLFGGILQVYGYFRYGTVWLAFQQLGKQNFQEVDKRLFLIKNPQLLSKSQKGFYYMLKGAVDLYHKKNYQSAEENIKKAIEIGVRTTNNICINYIMLSQLSMIQEMVDHARDYLEKALQTPHNSMLDEGLQNLKNEIEAAIQSRPLV